MKLITRILSVLILFSATLFYTSCKDDKKKKPQEQVQLEKLTTTWELTSASDGQDRTADFPNLILTLSGNFSQGGTYNYSFTGTRPNPSPWPVSGTWKFGADVSQDIIRDPGTSSEIEMDYEVTDTGLIISFTVPDGSAGWQGGTSRTNSVEGNWVFEFQKQ